jgi:hypothetical protein
MDRHTPFFVLALPRSRTTWLAHYLSHWPLRVAHDHAIECSTANEYTKSLSTAFDGTVETAAMIGFDAIRYYFPEAKVAVIRRPLSEVMASLQRFGLNPDIGEMRKREKMLEAISAQPGVLTTSYPGLSHALIRARLFEHCTGLPFDAEWDAYFEKRNIQIDMRARVQFLIDNAKRAETLKKDVLRYVSRPVATPDDVVYAAETWNDIWPECDDLAADHFEEVDGGVEPNRPYKVDPFIMSKLFEAGVLRIATARRQGKLVGYCTWNMTRDAESEGLIIAKQGAWYAEPGLGEVGRRLFIFSVKVLAELGVQNIFPHHRMQGRGMNLGKFFKSLGAKEVQHEYSLWIGDGQWSA